MQTTKKELQDLIKKVSPIVSRSFPFVFFQDSFLIAANGNSRLTISLSESFTGSLKLSEFKKAVSKLVAKTPVTLSQSADTLLIVQGGLQLPLSFKFSDTFVPFDLTEEPLPYNLTLTQSEIQSLKVSSTFTSDDPTRVALNYVNLDSEGYIQATNGHTAYRAPSDLTPEFPLNFSKEFIQYLSHFSDEKITVAYTEKQIRCKGFTQENSLYQFPRLQQLIPNQFSKLVSLDRVQFLNLLKRVEKISKTHTNIGVLAFDGQMLNVSAYHPEAKYEESIVVPGNLKDFKIGSNIGYLITCVSAFNSKTITLNMNTDRSPVVIKDSTDAVSLIMPVQIRS